ncbi:MAG TPA: hypothetical protein VG125_20470 [Pirellulales bacterium]|jgi:hypothetical protein|nr:hypothetical protein [Pirellulales bacterium]
MLPTIRDANAAVNNGTYPLFLHQFTLRALLVLLLAVACFFGGIRFERERRRRADEADRSERMREMVEAVMQVDVPWGLADIGLPFPDEQRWRDLERAEWTRGKKL